jgi:hypothetical protein
MATSQQARLLGGTTSARLETVRNRPCALLRGRLDDVLLIGVKYCVYCGREGHSSNDCPWLKQKSKGV